MKFGEAMRIAQGQTDWIRSRYNEYIQGPRDVEAEQQHAVRLLGLPERDRTKSWAASGSGKCLRQRQFAYLGMPGKRPDDHAANIFLNGTWVHIRHQVVGLAAGYLKDAEVPVAVEFLNLKGTMDAIDATGTPVEYKSINMNGYMEVKQFGVRKEHNHQIHGYMFAGEFESVRVVYENKNTNDLAEFHVQRDEDLINVVRSHLYTLEWAKDVKQLLPMLPECQEKKGQYRWCPFASQCATASYLEIEEKYATPATSSSVSD